jgi:hypothetical protein
MGIFGVGIFVDRWCGYSRRPSPDLDDKLDEDPERISPDTPALSPNLAGSPDTPALSSYTAYNVRKKEKNEEKNRSISVLFFYFFIKKKLKKKKI